MSNLIHTTYSDLMLNQNIHRGQAYLYCISFPNGRFKIGQSKDISSRIKSHQENFEAYTGQQFSDLYLFGPTSDVLAKEQVLIRNIEIAGNILSKGKEWFTLDKETGFSLSRKFVLQDSGAIDSELITKYFLLYRQTGNPLDYHSFMKFFASSVKTDSSFSPAYFEKLCAQLPH